MNFLEYIKKYNVEMHVSYEVVTDCYIYEFIYPNGFVFNIKVEKILLSDIPIDNYIINLAHNNYKSSILRRGLK